MADWHIAASLLALRTEINRKWPNRDKASDGALGDASHAARKSDHNPDWDAGGVVRAIDVDKDGIDVQQLLDATIRDPRVWYVIWNRHIYSRTHGWVAQDYTGANPHDKHVHISLMHTSKAEHDTSAWFDGADTPTPEPEELTVADVQAILAYQKACTIQIQNNTRQLLNNAVAGILDGVQKYAVAVNNFTRQTDAGSDSERQAELDKLQADLATSLGEVLNAVSDDVPEPPK